MEKNIKDQIVEEIAVSLGKVFEEKQKEKHQYVVEYRNSNDDSLIGYHLSSFCQVGQNRLEAKRYSGDNPYPQLETIHKNLIYTLNINEDSEGMFVNLSRKIKEDYFKGLSVSDVYLSADYLEEDVEPQTFVFAKITGNE